MAPAEMTRSPWQPTPLNQSAASLRALSAAYATIGRRAARRRFIINVCFILYRRAAPWPTPASRRRHHVCCSPCRPLSLLPPRGEHGALATPTAASVAPAAGVRPAATESPGFKSSEVTVLVERQQCPAPVIAVLYNDNNRQHAANRSASFRRHRAFVCRLLWNTGRWERVAYWAMALRLRRELRGDPCGFVGSKLVSVTLNGFERSVQSPTALQVKPRSPNFSAKSLGWLSSFRP
ncbi:hypothetical protein E2C01_026936 [Portunus trituberculatus]|uniref:Uncharacterized protein n=1 Tax=Portunus trituberculatus TaxID=210409 RepID=A0A5B7EGU0_PORTR|nr:hypothetical protein [Portunus trituberculatus]